MALTPARHESRFQIRERRIGYRHLIAVHGTLGEVHVPAIFDAFWDAIEHGAREVWLDVSSVVAIDAHVAPAISRLVASVHELNRTLVIICPPGPVHRRLAEHGLLSEVAVFETVSAAHYRA